MAKRLLRIRNPRLPELINVLLTTIAKAELEGAPLTYTQLNAFGQRWIDRLLEDGYVTDGPSELLSVDAEQIRLYGQWEVQS